MAENGAISPTNMMTWAGWIGGLAFIVLIIILALWVPDPTGFQEFAFRVPMSIGAAAFCAFVPGFLIVQAFTSKKDKQAGICGGGAIVVFILLMYVNPTRLGAPVAKLFGAAEAPTPPAFPRITDPVATQTANRGGVIGNTRGDNSPVQVTNLYIETVNFTVDLKAVEQALKKHPELFNKIFSQHPNKQFVYTIDGKQVLAVPFDPSAGGSRVSNNFDFAANTAEKYRIIIVNVPRNERATIKFQVKEDVQFDEDPNLGGVLGDRQLVPADVINGSKRYLALRSDAQLAGAAVLFVPESIELTKLKQLPGLDFQQ